VVTGGHVTLTGTVSTWSETPPSRARRLVRPGGEQYRGSTAHRLVNFNINNSRDHY